MASAKPLQTSHSQNAKSVRIDFEIKPGKDSGLTENGAQRTEALWG
jgi:hypothetical protein